MKTLSQEVAAAEQEILLSVLCVRWPHKDWGHPLPLPSPEIMIAKSEKQHVCHKNNLYLGTRQKRFFKVFFQFSAELGFYWLGYFTILKKLTCSFCPLKNVNNWGFPGGAVVENLPANAGDTGSSPGLGGSHVPQSSWARESQLLSLRIWSLCSATGEAAIVRGPRTAMKRGPHLPQLEKALAQKRRPNTAINKLINF